MAQSIAASQEADAQPRDSNFWTLALGTIGVTFGEIGTTFADTSTLNSLYADGGYGPASALASAELYDPVTDAWAATASMSTTRFLHAATAVASGKILVTGGIGAPDVLTSAELYDPAAGAWVAAGAMVEPRHSHTATLLGNGKVLLAGGGLGGSQLTAELYAPVGEPCASACATRRMMFSIITTELSTTMPKSIAPVVAAEAIRLPLT